ncbi:MAG: hypothetical protein AAB368_09060, partial [bacterium]
MDEFRAWCREGLVAGLHALEESHRAFREGDGEAAESLRRLARLLHGTSSLYGFADITRAAGRLLGEGPVIPADVEALIEVVRGVTTDGRGEPGTDVLVI